MKRKSRTRDLKAGVFRYLNEMLYTHSGENSMEYFARNPDMFGQYHEGYSAQLAQWPVLPLDIVYTEIRERLVRGRVADLGCGNGELSERLVDAALQVFSYDLVSTKPFIIPCNVTKLPLKSRYLHCVVCCLSLMSSDHVAIIQETHRVLKRKGLFIVAEVKSRVPGDTEFFTQMKSLGFAIEKIIRPNDYFSVYVFNKRKPRGEIPSSIFKPCKYKKR